MTPGTRAALDAARIRCAEATARHRKRETGRVPVDHQALARRRAAAIRLPPLACGHRDPLTCERAA